MIAVSDSPVSSGVRSAPASEIRASAASYTDALTGMIVNILTIITIDSSMLSGFLSLCIEIPPLLNS